MSRANCRDSRWSNLFKISNDCVPSFIHDVTNYSVKYFYFFKVFVHSISMVTSAKDKCL